MLGRTHMAIGALGAIAATPVLLHVQTNALHPLFKGAVAGHFTGITNHLEAEAVFVVAGILGSLLPDLDQQDSLAAHRVEHASRLAMVALLIALLFIMHWETSIYAWVLAVIFALFIRSRNNVARIAGLACIAAGLLYVGWTGVIPMIASIALAAWLVGAMLTAHRTFTHSTVGVILFGIGITPCKHMFIHVHAGIAVYGLLLGYILHLVADAIAGGVPVFWPIKKRLGIRLVKTGSTWDHFIGGVAVLACLGLAFA